MAVDEALNARVRQMLGDQEVTEKRMFSGTCFMLNGNMLCAVNRERMFFRVGKEQNEAALKRPGARPVEMRGRPLAGFVWVDRAQLKDGRSLKRWLAMAQSYVDALPAKKIKRGSAPVL